MSGVEVAGLVFGVLPILIEAIKAYSAVSDGLHTFRHWSREVKSISLQLKVQNGIFLNECRLLLRLAEDEKVAENMLYDATDRRWTSKELNDRLNTMLNDNFELCRSIIEETKDVTEDMKEEMKKFDALEEQKYKNEKLKSAIKRLRGALSITFDKSRYEKHLANLRDRNSDLSALRLQISAFQQTTRAAGTLVRHKTLPDRFQSIQNASQKLHEALCSAWCCDDLAHRGHYAKLCLDAEVQNEVHLDLAISCHDNNGNGGLSREPPIWLYVQSLSMTTPTCIATASEIVTDLRTALPVELLASTSTNSLKKKASSELTQPSTCKKLKKKPKRVHFVDAAIAPSPSPVPSADVTELIPPDFNLCQTKSICNYLQRNYRACARTCVGYLETPQMYKHMFFARRNSSKEIEHTTVYSIFDIMGQEADDFLDVQDQLKLAHKTALAILQYNGTPWMSERWRLAQMSYFGNKHSFDKTALKTLHLSSQISSPSQQTATAMDGIERLETGVSDEIRYGINNLPLFFLGVALLEIAHWTPLEEKMIARDANDQVYAARRLASGRAPLGPEYQKIAQKCLQCNFGFGTKLNSKGLQAAVYNDVVCELEGMIEKLAV
ncbi:Nn.00g093280.m01.CDS01 [Neocucurbitaria sp. VM-36]